MDVPQPHFQSSPNTALRELLKAYHLALQHDEDPWEFSVDVHTLRALGLTVTDLRNLLLDKQVDHAEEITRSDDTRRNFRAIGSLFINEGTCFVLTDIGVETASQLRSRDPVSAPVSEADSTLQSENCVPHWDPERRVLSYRGQQVKEFRWQAPNQETLLAAFAEEGWPPRIDDPLPPKHDTNPRDRLHDAIQGLNRYQRAKLKFIRFRGDGTGEGIIWEPV